MKTIDILNVKVNVLDMNQLLEYVCSQIKCLSGQYITVANVHTTVMAYEDESYCNIQNSAVITIADGGPLSAIGRNRGFKYMQRLTGPDFMEEILKVSHLYGFTHYFYGSTQETLDKLKSEILMKYPNINIVGMYSPPFRKLSTSEDITIVNHINELNPTFIWVGLGAPKQEIWMYEHKDKFNGVMVGVGAAFDYFAKNIKRAPMWMQRLSLEWLYRLIQDPKRLFKRYMVTNFKFIYYLFINRK